MKEKLETPLYLHINTQCLKTIDCQRQSQCNVFEDEDERQNIQKK